MGCFCEKTKGEKSGELVTGAKDPKSCKNSDDTYNGVINMETY